MDEDLMASTENPTDAAKLVDAARAMIEVVYGMGGGEREEWSYGPIRAAADHLSVAVAMASAAPVPAAARPAAENPKGEQGCACGRAFPHRALSLECDVLSASPRPLDDAERLIRACEVLRFNPCNCESCLPYKHGLILDAVDALASPHGLDDTEVERADQEAMSIAWSKHPVSEDVPSPLRTFAAGWKAHRAAAARSHEGGEAVGKSPTRRRWEEDVASARRGDPTAKMGTPHTPPPEPAARVGQQPQDEG